MITFFKSKAKELRAKVEQATGQYLGRYRVGLDVNVQPFVTLVGSDSAESGSTSNTIVATAHSARVGDLIKITSGTFSGDILFVLSTDTNSIVLSQDLASAIQNGTTFSIYRVAVGVVNSDGSFNASISGTPNVNVVTWGSATTESLLDDFSTPHAAITVMGWDHSTPTPIAIPVAPGAGGSGYEVQSSYHQRTQGTFPAYGKIAGTSLTTSYATLVTMSGNVRGFTIMNSCDQAVIITLDGGSTNNLELDAYESYTADLASLGVYLNSSTIQAKHAGTLPKVGSVRCWIIK